MIAERGHDLEALSAERGHDLEALSAERIHDLEAFSSEVTLTALNGLVEEIFENCIFFETCLQGIKCSRYTGIKSV